MGLRTGATTLLADPPVTPEGGWLGSTLEPAPSGGEQVRLLVVDELANVNAPVPDQRFTFGPTGITVVYGDFRSGKSGYARLIKRLVRARHHEDILPGIFTRTEGAPEALVAYSLGEETHEERWGGQATGPLSQVSFYDERFGYCRSAWRPKSATPIEIAPALTFLGPASTSTNAATSPTQPEEPTASGAMWTSECARRNSRSPQMELGNRARSSADLRKSRQAPLTVHPRVEVSLPMRGNLSEHAAH